MRGFSEVYRNRTRKTDPDWNVEISKQILRGKHYHEGCQTLKQVAINGYVISSLGNAQGLTGQVLEQPDLIRPALSMGLDYAISRAPFQPKLCCDSMFIVSPEAVKQLK